LHGLPMAAGGRMTDRIELDELPARMRLASEELARIGAAIRYYGGFGPFSEWGDMLETQTVPMMVELSSVLESMIGSRA